MNESSFAAVTPENYEEKRAELLSKNENLTGLILREREMALDARLQALKEELFASFSGDFPYEMPLLTDRRLTESRLYRFCSEMPKGADLHVHDMALLPVPELIGLLCTRPEFCIRGDHIGYDLLAVPVGEKLPDGYIRFAEAMKNGVFTEDELLENWTVLGAKASGRGIWDFFETLFDRHAALPFCLDFVEEYYIYTFRYYCEKHIRHVEIHQMLTESMDDTLAYLRAVRRAYYTVKREYPDFTARVIGAGVKADSDRFEMTKRCFLNTTYAQEILRDESDPENPEPFVLGFDLVNEEDASLPLRDFAPLLLKAKRQYPEMRYFIHGGESLDASNENLFDAYLLGVSRVGHGFNLYRYPDLHARYIRAEICLEVCPISNQALGYTKDIRSHPATEYLRSGMALALCSDDPIYMEHETLTDDFFAAVCCWNLGLAELKQLALNSILYSGLTDRAKTSALRAFSAEWAEFTEKMLAE